MYLRQGKIIMRSNMVKTQFISSAYLVGKKDITDARNIPVVQNSSGKRVVTKFRCILILEELQSN